MIALKKKTSYFPCSVFGITIVCLGKESIIFFKKKRLNRCPVEKSYAIPPHDSKWDWSLRLFGRQFFSFFPFSFLREFLDKCEAHHDR